MKTIAIIQARLGSKRFPKKIFKKINGISLIEILLKRVTQVTKLNNIILATSDKETDKPLVELAEDLSFNVYQGSETDVLDRFYNAAKIHSAETIIRITGDCPFNDPKLINQVLEIYKTEKSDYASNTNPPTYPDGLDVEVFSFKALEECWLNAKSSYDREHVTPYIIKSNLFKKSNLKNNIDYSDLRITIDYQEDFELIKNIFNAFDNDIYVGWEKIVNYLEKNKEIMGVNRKYKRNNKINTGQSLWSHTKKIIPGGNMLLSKRPEMFLPGTWPAYYKKSKGCKVWDLDNNEYIDMSIMGIGTNIMGYANDQIDKAVMRAVKDGNMSTLNCPEEVELAETLLNMHSWADMARFARSGGEANAIAIRIARAASGKDNIAVCGYHGWHDWYLSANMTNKQNLNSHLLEGLKIDGVPKGLKDTVFTFNYNDLETLEKIINEKDIGIIKMEVIRNKIPNDNFLEEVRKIATQNNIILIFDECTSGFRETFGGIHKKYGVNPDMAMFGKALGNGYPVTAVIGKKNIMDSAQSSFISSTFWTDRIGSVAAIETLKCMEETKSWEIISKTGLEIKERWMDLALKYELEIEISGISSLPNFTFKSKFHNIFKTFISQEMLKKGFLASNSIYVCINHSEEIIDKYFLALRDIFMSISNCKETDIENLIEGEPAHTGFQRLN